MSQWILLKVRKLSAPVLSHLQTGQTQDMPMFFAETLNYAIFMGMGFTCKSNCI